MPRSAAAATLADGSIHAWRARMDALPADLEPLVSALPADERATAARIRDPGRRRHFVTGRAVLRSVLARYLDSAAAHRPFDYLPDGKPVLRGDAGLHFNLAHSGDVVVAAVAAAGPLGVDVERVRPVTHLAAIARSWLTERERGWLAAQPESGRAEAFLLLWTCREAVAKADGQGISRAWSRIELVMADGVPAAAVSPGRRWSVIHPRVPDGYVAAIAAACDRPTVQTFEWTPEPGIT